MDKIKRVMNPPFVLAIVVLIVLIFRPLLYKHHLLPTKNSSSTTNVKRYGIDVSHYQGNINWSLAKDDISFAFVKATNGTVFVDPQYIENSEALLKEGVVSGAYHFYEPSQDPIKQASHFVKTISSSGHKLRPVLDIEITNGKSAKNISSGALKWLKYVEEKIGCKPMIYTFASYWDNNLGDKFNRYNYWLAAWTTKSKPVPPNKRSDWQLWQFTNKGHVKGIKGLVDRDLFDGSKQNFDKLLCS